MLRTFGRVLTILLGALLPLAALTWVASSSWIATAVGALAGLVLLGLAVWRAEDSLIHAHAGISAPPAGLLRSYERATGEWPEARPRLLVFRDPLPNALALRGAAGPGTVLVSQGVIALLDEGSLRAMLRHCALECRRPGIRFRTFSAAMAQWTLRCVPSEWIELCFRNRPGSRPELGPLAVVPFLLLYPIAQFFLTASRPAPVYPDGSSESEESGVVAGALRELKSSSRCHLSVIPGASFLYVVDPWGSDMLFPLTS